MFQLIISWETSNGGFGSARGVKAYVINMKDSGYLLLDYTMDNKNWETIDNVKHIGTAVAEPIEG